ncbi:MAG: alcohol dehydrogenase catalytic domain-containing protein, partial [Alphaproteobacteria bacterium]|nr:alcohol dehydrogenase catalytic domain-containing protein [Alphaproteobacteria bacterium]
MRSYQIADYAAPLALAEGAAPTPTGTEVLLRIHACGVCHSDVHLWEGYFYLGGGRRIVSPPPDALP